LRIVHDDANRLVAFFEGNPGFPGQILLFQVLEQVARNGRIGVEGDKTALVKIFQRLTDVALVDVVLLQENTLNRLLGIARFLPAAFRSF
jgi:hypothetical protein